MLRYETEGGNLPVLICYPQPGPRKAYIQSMPLMATAQALSPYISISGGSSDNDGISIKLGN